MSQYVLHMNFQAPFRACIIVAIMLTGCSSYPTEPPSPIQMAEFHSKLDSFGKGKWESINVVITPKNVVAVQIYVLSETHAIALKAYCNVVNDAFDTASLTDYKIDARMKLAGQSDKTC